MLLRAATRADLPALAALHVRTWNATYPHHPMPPAYAIRERQWREAFASDDGDWRCCVLAGGAGQLVGFAKIERFGHPELPDFAGKLSKLYLLADFQRRGWGRRLVGHAARWLLTKGITSMVVFSEPDNPAGQFYEALGGVRVLAPNGEFHGTYGWRDLHRLAADCPER